MKRALQFLAIGALAGVFVSHASADEIKLKDGSKIVGTIVGFEENSFRVKTSYGFALIQKDQVVSISVLEAEKKPEAEKNPEAAGDKSAASPKPAKAKTTGTSSPTQEASETVDAPSASGKLTATTAASTSSPGPEAKAATAPKTAPTPTAAGSTNSGSASTKPSAPPVTAATASAPSSPSAVAQPKAAEPDAVKEEVSGNTYTNRTWGFQMYKPPDWQVIDGARSMLPGAITAMGTADQKTYLLIGEQTAGKSLANDMDAMEGRLRDVLENYRSLGEKRVTVSGLSAIQHKFRGSIDNHDWSGLVVYIPRDTHLYTIFGMTYADSDLVQIQENILARAISSVQFAKQ